ncbi:MAG: hypothetical protein QOC68_338 [Solirubrobacteraceae bacterium]|nr:hypothetical protein [Solirubrobacteraceae bacterium]
MAGGRAPRHAGAMTTYATNITPFAAPTRNRTGPILATITGGVAAFLAIILIAGGAALFWVSHDKVDADGYYSTATHHYSSPTRALTTQNLDVGANAPDWLFSSETFGHVRIDPRSTSSAKPVFVGIARTSDVTAYLDQVQHDEISDIEFDPFTIDKSRRAGEGRPAMPAAQTFWAASSADGHPVDWKVRSGNWSVVMMNADGSPGVSVDASVGANAPLIRDLAWWLTIPGAALGLIALLLVAVGVRGLTRSNPQPAVAAAA